MTKPKIEDLPTDSLVSLFSVIGEKQFRAAENFQTALFSKLFEEMNGIVSELKVREGDQRRALLALLDHENAQVRLKAAIHTLAIDSARSRAVLQELADRGEFPTGADARGMIRALREGRYIPS